MSMKFKDKFNVAPEFDDLFAFANEEEELEHEAKMLSFQALQALENCYLTGPKLKKKEIAQALGKSASFISQLYAGDKLMSFPLLAKIEKELGVSFQIKAQMSTHNYSVPESLVNISDYSNQANGTWIWKSKPEYSKPSNDLPASSDIKDKNEAA